MEVFAPRRIVLLGKTGVGKSSLANILVGNDVFRTDHSPNSGTSECQAKTISVNRRSVTVVDTPDFFNPNIPEEKLKKATLSCMIECSPGPHAFLILLKVEKFTNDEKAVVAKICDYFSEEAFRFAAVVFTHGDQLPEGTKIEEWVDKSDALRDLVKKCGGRCHVIDSKYWKTSEDKYRNNKVQEAELLKTIDKIIIKNKGGFYTNEMLQKVEKVIAEEEKRIRKSSCYLSPEEIRNRAKKAALKERLIARAPFVFDAITGDSVPQRIVLLGKAGVGKSSIANILAGDDVFGTDHTGNSGTSECQAETISVNRRSVTVVDTPDFFDPNMPEEKLKKAILSCMIECSPGPHVFLILLKVEKYTEHEKAVVKKICECFSEEAFRFAAVVFTHGDQLPEGMKIEEFVNKSDGLRDLVKKCRGRCNVIDKYWKTSEDEYRSNKVQVAELLMTIEKIKVENKEVFYTNETLQKVAKLLEKKEKRIRMSSHDLSPEEIRKQAKKYTLDELLIDFRTASAAALLALLGGTLALMSVVLLTAAIVGGGVAAVVGAPVLGVVAVAGGAVLAVSALAEGIGRFFRR